MGETMNVAQVLELAKKENVRFVDLKFIDMLGTWQHFTVPISELDEKSFEHGFGFDGSSIRGFKEIFESDMLVIPDPATAIIDPFSESTLSLVCDIKDPETGEPFTRDPRYIAKKAEKFLISSGLADIAYIGPELEFFIFDNVRFDQRENFGFYYLDSSEAAWNRGTEGANLGYQPRYKEGYFPVPPADSLQSIRNEIVDTLTKAGVNVECHHHEVATAGQCEIDMRFQPLLRMADQVMLYKYIVRNVAKKHNKSATFMPKPIFNDNGSGMHTHQSLWKGGKNIFFDKAGYAGLSETALHYIGGLLHHAPALCAFIAPTTNSYKRLVPGFEAPVNLVYSKRNRSAAVRIPVYSASEKAKRVEFRTPDPTCNPYLAFAAMLMAGLDGVKRKLSPGEPLDKDIFNLGKAELSKIRSVPGSLPEAVDALEKDHDFLLQGGVFTNDVVEAWIEYKRTKEIDPIRLRPHPWEFHLYYDA